jgi:hypothetical protein
MKNDILGIALLAATAVNIAMFFAIAVPALGLDDDEEKPDPPVPEFNYTESQVHFLRRVTDPVETGGLQCSRSYACEP